VIDKQIVIRPMMYASFSYDHRIVDGRESVSFLVRVKELLENPDQLLFGERSRRDLARVIIFFYFAPYN
jgi:2-oxoglutarate dehydrogenase E2 component (dihydrolipoamide succinyltransferase)